MLQLNCASLLQLPTRLCNPPPAVGKVRSCSGTPVAKIRLDDVLSRVHLPPLGLKDFEEWLLYVEQYPTGLYFLLWLREYELRYSAWKSSLGRPRVGRTRQTPHQASTTLSMFFARAKHTFLTPKSAFELNVPSSLLAPFHISHSVPYHPDPSVFADLQADVRKALEESLARFVKAQCSNAGGGRVLCGILAGVFFTLVGGLLPILYTMLLNQSRFLRLTGLPGLLLGLTILLASLNGICVAIYIFGDFRQLRKFELSRPEVSTQSPTRRPSSNLVIPSPVVYSNTPEITPRSSIYSVYSDISTSSMADVEVINGIYISGAYRDDSPVQDVAPPKEVPRPSSGKSSKTNFAYPPSATFILPFQERNTESPRKMPYAYDDHPQALQPLSYFDFDALPPRPPKYGFLLQSPADESEYTIHDSYLSDKQLNLNLTPKSFLGRMQSSCTNAQGWRHHRHHPEMIAAQATAPSFKQQLRSISKQVRSVNSVPAFSTPFVRILSPVIVRAHFDIVLRSFLFATILSCVLTAFAIAVPELPLR